MENITEKKWYVYVKDHHEGPHTISEIKDKISQGIVEDRGFVWSEGMKDWEPMGSLPAFELMLRDGLKAKKSQAFISRTKASHDQLQKIGDPDPGEWDEDFGQDPVTVVSDQAHSSKKKWELFSFRSFGRVTVLVLVIGTTFVMRREGYLDQLAEIPLVVKSTEVISSWSRPYLLRLMEHVDFLDQFISPIPKIDDVSAEEFEELKNAARARIYKSGPKFAIALSQFDPLSPYFYVSTNLGEGAQFQLFVQGISDTLLNQLSFSAQSSLVVSNKTGKSALIHFADGRPVPKGEYLIYLTLLENQSPEVKIYSDRIVSISNQTFPELPKGSKVVAFKSYFLGGKRDFAYQTRLKDFHEKLRGRALSEVNEAKQFMVTLSSQFETTQDQFLKSRKEKIINSQRKSWEIFHNTWINLENELDQIFLKWTPEALKNEYYYGTLYKLIQDAGQKVNRVHGLQQAYFTESFDPQTYEVQLKNEITSANEAIEILKSKIAAIEKLPPTPGGMPQREFYEN